MQNISQLICLFKTIDVRFMSDRKLRWSLRKKLPILFNRLSCNISRSSYSVCHNEKAAQDIIL